MKIKYDNETIKVMSLFGAITRTKLKDYFQDVNGMAVFIVEKFELGKAVGKKGANVKLLEKKLNRKIKIVEFSSDVLQFVKNYVFPLKVKDVTQEEKTIVMESPDSKTRGLLIGRAAGNLRNLEKITQRYFDIDEIKVV